MCIRKTIILKKLSIESLKESAKERLRLLIVKIKQKNNSQRKTEDSSFYSTGVFTSVFTRHSHGNLVS